MGFSLGGNHLARYLGKNKSQELKAAVLISPAVDALASGLGIKYTAFGLYGKSILDQLNLNFKLNRYKIQDDLNDN